MPSLDNPPPLAVAAAKRLPKAATGPTLWLLNAQAFL